MKHPEMQTNPMSRLAGLIAPNDTGPGSGNRSLPADMSI